MMLIQDSDVPDKCRLPYAALNEENSKKGHMVLGSFVL
jgi:hypothetical protein